MSAKKIAYQKTSLSMIEKTINNIVQKKPLPHRPIMFFDQPQLKLFYKGML